MKIKLSKFVMILLCIVMIVGLFGGCAATANESSKESSKESTTENATVKETAKESQTPQKVVTLDVILNLGSGLQEGLWWTDYLEEKVGVKLNIINGNDTDLATYIAGNNLPDAVHFANSTENMRLAVQADQLLNIDDYADSLPNTFKTINNTALDYQRKTFGGLYFLPGASSETGTTFGGTEYGMRINLPYFEEYIEANGYPELKTLEDFIPVLAWIQQKHPTNKEGQNAYGMSFFTDWDGASVAYARTFMQQLGYYPSLWPVLVKCDDMSTSYAFDDNSIFYKVLHFMFAAQQAGIVDPDSLTQTWDDYMAKTTANRTYSSYCWSIPADCKLVTYDEYHPVSYSGPWMIGNWNGNAGLGISAKTEKLDKVLETIDFACDYNNVWYCLFGPQGEYWDLNSSGQPVLTDLAYKMKEDETLQLAEGGNPAFDAPNFNLRLLGYTQTVHPTYGFTAITDSWPADASRKSDVQNMWEAFCKKQYNVDLNPVTLSEVGLLNKLNKFSAYRSEFGDAAISEDMNDLLTRAGSIVPDAAWKMIYAANENEFNSLWKALQSDLNAINFRSVYDYEVKKLQDGEIWYVK